MTTKPSLFAPLLPTAALALVIACSSSSPSGASPSPGDVGDEEPEPGNGSSSSGNTPTPRPDGGNADSGGPTDEGPELLVRGDVVLLGVTTDDHAIYRRTTKEGQALEAVSLADRSITTIWAGLPANASVEVKGNAVAIWTDIDAGTGLGSFSYWTPNKPTRRNVAQLSVPASFWATENGSLVAFEANATLTNDVPTAADLAVVSTATGELTTVLTGAEQIAFDAASCGSSIGFAGETLLAAYCPPGADTARLVTVPKAAPSERRVLVDGGLRPTWRADATGSKIFVIAQQDDEGRIVIDDGTDPAPVMPIETDVKEAFVMKDGSAVVYRAGTTLRRAPLGTSGTIVPVTIATGEARGILDVSLDQSRILYRSSDGEPVDASNPDGERYFDLQSIATSATEAAPNVLVDTPRALPLNLTGDGSYALYLSKAPRLVSTAMDGSGERSRPLDFNEMTVAPTGARAIISVNSRQSGTKVVTDLVYVDFSKNGTEAGSPLTKQVAESVGSGGYRFGLKSKNSLVFAQFPQDGQAGLYRTELP